MAVRRKINHNEDVKKRIQASQLVNRLQDNAFGKIEPELSAGQLKSIDILLRKTIPDLQSVSMNATHEVGESIFDLLKAIDGTSRGIPTRS